MKRQKRRKMNRIKRHSLGGRNLHHLIPKSRGGVDTNSNLLLIGIEKHEAWHKLWGTRTVGEVLCLLERVVRAKEHQGHYPFKTGECE